MEIVYFGHSCFRIKGKETTVVCDPYDPEMVGFKLAGLEADVVTVSHEHEDHNFVAAVAGTTARPEPFLIKGPGEYEVGGVTILGFGSFHDQSNGEERGRNVIYKIIIEGIRVCHLGDLGHKLPQSVLDELGEVDVLLVPVGGKGKALDGTMAAEVVTQVEPGIVIPMHYQTEGGKLDLDPVERFFEAMGVQKGEEQLSLRLMLGQVPEEREVILLKKK